MQYISGMFALNLKCSLDTCGDWHQSGMNWQELKFRETDESIFGDYGIEPCSHVPEHKGNYMIADTLRALLDLLEENRLTCAQGMREDFICNEDYTQEFFKKVLMLQHLEHWDSIDRLMKREYMQDWLDFKLEVKGGIEEI